MLNKKNLIRTVILSFLFLVISNVINEDNLISDFRTFFGITIIILLLILFFLRKDFLIKPTYIIGLFFFMIIYFLEFHLTLKDQRNYSSKPKGFVKQVCGSSFVNKENLNIYPLGGISFKKINFLNSENLATNSSINDRYGFKNENSIWDLSSIDYIFLGDSFTWGADVESSDGFANLHAQKYPKTLNLSCPGSGPLIQYGIFREYITKLKPRNVLWIYFSNDLRKDLPSEVKNYGNYLNKNFDQKLTKKQNIIDDLIFKQLNIKTEENPQSLLNQFFSFVKLTNLRGHLFSFSFKKESFIIYKKILENVNNEVQSWNGNLHVILIRHPKSFSNLISDNDEKSYYKYLINNLSEKINIIDFTSSIDSEDYKELYSNRRGHFNIEGNQIFHEFLVKSVLNY